ncbi:gamma-D-glutamyl-meso-diaminopimelate peptidase [Lactobacillus sp. CBA3605]|uniref:C40 family peptidase n=1 Tax=Lactobacillus sp. CBA3605 TaxID=2099788 RepID=UPI000CFD14A9|nr:C40 family peptidase [Lactobacillus sp. CBA3605]AVK60851.1 gamma-D-glutamyl-meso-diaminopimelate peptidase [Lactobacillus sp. CBA3605]
MRTARVQAAVATVWRQPKVASTDLAALANQGLQGWLTKLSDADTLRLERDNILVTQALFNDLILVERLVDGWAYGYVVSQADERHPQGYPGWIWAAQLSLVELPIQTGPLVTVRRAITPLLRSDGTTLRQLRLGTQLPVITSQDGHYDVVQTPLGPGRLAKRATQFDFATAGLTPGGTMIKLGQRFLDDRYLWGGISADGFDCSGFAWALHRCIGVNLARDVSEQVLSGVTVTLATAQPGDLCFFAHDHGRGRLHHVALYAGDGWLLHAPTPGKHVTYLQLSATYLQDELVQIKRNWENE